MTLEKEKPKTHGPRALWLSIGPGSWKLMDGVPELHKVIRPSSDQERESTDIQERTAPPKKTIPQVNIPVTSTLYRN